MHVGDLGAGSGWVGFLAWVCLPRGCRPSKGSGRERVGSADVCSVYMWLGGRLLLERPRG